jgi:hypothetical protein
VSIVVTAAAGMFRVVPLPKFSANPPKVGIAVILTIALKYLIYKSIKILVRKI